MEKTIGLIVANYNTPDMLDLTDDRGIASMPFGGRYRLIDFALSNMINANISSVGVITPQRYRSLLDHIGMGSPWMLDKKRGGLHILPGTPYGMGYNGGIFPLRDLMSNRVYFDRADCDYILFTSANYIYNMDYNELIKAHIESKADITMAYQASYDDNPNALKLNMEDQRVLGTAKTALKDEPVFMDLFVISREFLMKLFEWYGAVDYMDIFKALEDDYKRLNIQGWEYKGYARSIFNIDDYYKASMDLLKNHVYSELFDKEPIRTKVQDCVPTRYKKDSRIKNTLLPSGCVIEGSVENCILFRGVKIGKGAVVRNSIIMQATEIGDYASIDYAVIDRNNHIPNGQSVVGTHNKCVVITKERV